MGEFNNFTSGVRDFLSETHLHPMNDKIKMVLEAKEYILREDIMVMWESNPSVRIYYVTMGRRQESPHIDALSKQFKLDIASMNIYDETFVHLIDSKSLKDICDNNINFFTETIEVIDSMPLTPVESVGNSSMVLCYATEIYKLMLTPDGVIRKSLFDDNVRDFQGETSINEEIKHTISLEPQKFVLLNNGLTIVCDEYRQNNRKITLSNPQIVNGCQTSNVIYFAKETGLDISKVPVSVKIIATSDDHITSQVVRGTNKQNIVYDEAFETIRDFHKELEEFFSSMQQDLALYYERRSKQYNNNPSIKQTQKVSFRALIQGFIGLFLNEPHTAYRHESLLVREYRNRVFIDRHSKLPYYATAVAVYYIEKFFRENEVSRENKNLKYHILLLARQIIGGSLPALHKEKEIDSYCKTLISRLNVSYEQVFFDAIKELNRCKDVWVNRLGRSVNGIKDVSEFTDLLLSENAIYVDRKSRETGKVIKVLIDRNGFHYGFISRLPQNIFFHANVNNGLDFPNIEGKFVSYLVMQHQHREDALVAVDVRIEV